MVKVKSLFGSSNRLKTFVSQSESSLELLAGSLRFVDQRITNEIEARVRSIPGAVDVSSNLEGGQPEIVARVNRTMAADLGFSVGGVAAQLRGMVEGIVPTRLRDGDREHDVRVRLAPEHRNDPASVLREASRLPRARVLRHRRNLGKTEAMLTGAEAAESEYPLVDGLEELVRRLEASGVTMDRGYTPVPALGIASCIWLITSVPAHVLIFFAWYVAGAIVPIDG